MEIRVISLPTSARRRESIAAQFRQQRLSFEFFAAINGRDALAYVHHYDNSEFVRNCGRSATANEIGCYASHLALWRECASGDRAFLILEDDAHIRKGFADGFRVVAKHIDRLGLVRVSVPEARSFIDTEHDRNFEIRYCRRVPLLAVGYAISPKAAAQLMSCANVVEEPIDKFIQRFWLHGQAVHALHPQIIRPGDIAKFSEIGDRSRPQPGLATWSSRLLRKIENSIRRDVYVLRLMLRILRARRYGQSANSGITAPARERS